MEKWVRGLINGREVIRVTCTTEHILDYNKLNNEIEDWQRQVAMAQRELKIAERELQKRLDYIKEIKPMREVEEIGEGLEVAEKPIQEGEEMGGDLGAVSK